jgi:outer membrane protein
MKRILFLALVTFLVSNIAFSQQTKLWTLQECVDYAFKNNLNLKNTENQTVINRNNLFQSQMGLLPTVAAGGSISQSSGGRSFDPFTNQAVQDVTYRNSNLSLSSSWNLYSGLQAQNGIKSNKTGLKASQLDVATQRNTISLNIINGYVSILNNYEQLANAKKQLDLTEEQVKRTEKLVAAGSSAEVI